MIALPARLIRQRDGDDAVPRPPRIGKLKPFRGVGLDVELQTLELPESHPEEMRLPGQHQVLCHRIGEEKIWRVERAGGLARGFVQCVLAFSKSLQL